MLYLIAGIILLVIFFTLGPAGLLTAIVGFILWRIGALSFVFNMIGKIFRWIFIRLVNLYDTLFGGSDSVSSYLFDFGRVLLS
ncbi:hypothetical protein [Saccharibacillus qingshengii]|uniref:hypothetical protein n=1 Tax=Saccharibacillus qingshengii TaxID=1763540 RepID=UPI001557C74E|nr:hypothetical protein [Saccharibacillus qingshengii]